MLRGTWRSRPSIRDNSSGRGRRSATCSDATTSSRGDSHCACDGAYFVCVDRRSMSGPPDVNASLTQRVQLGVRHLHDDFDRQAEVLLEPGNGLVERVVHRAADEDHADASIAALHHRALRLRAAGAAFLDRLALPTPIEGLLLARMARADAGGGGPWAISIPKISDRSPVSSTLLPAVSFLTLGRLLPAFAMRSS